MHTHANTQLRWWRETTGYPAAAIADAPINLGNCSGDTMASGNMIGMLGNVMVQTLSMHHDMMKMMMGERGRKRGCVYNAFN